MFSHQPAAVKSSKHLSPNQIMKITDAYKAREGCMKEAKHCQLTVPQFVM